MYARYVALRDQMGIRDADVAKATNIPASTFTDWKNNKSKPKAEKLLKIAQFFNVPVEELIDKKSEV